MLLGFLMYITGVALLIIHQCRNKVDFNLTNYALILGVMILIFEGGKCVGASK